MSATPKPHVVVIIDDDEAVRDSMRALLEAFGYAVRDYASAESYLASDPGGANCLLVDQHMPGMTGIELLAHLHGNRDFTPALMITGRTDPALAQRLAHISVKLLTKPVMEDTLIEAIEEACRIPARNGGPQPGASRRCSADET